MLFIQTLMLRMKNDHNFRNQPIRNIKSKKNVDQTLNQIRMEIQSEDNYTEEAETSTTAPIISSFSFYSCV